MLEAARRELANFLRSRRASAAPATFGFPISKSRRTPGLRREEVAAAAGVGLTWYTALEQGKPIQVSASFLENVARALRLTPAERAHLFALAQRREPTFSSQSADSKDVSIQMILDGIIHPAYARTNRFDVLAWNASNTSYFGNFAAIPPEERNVVRLMFTRSYHRKSMPNWDADVRSLLATFRFNFGRASDPRGYLSLIAELKAISPAFERLWAMQDVSDRGEGVTRLTSPRLGDLHFTHQVLALEGRPETQIVMFIPASPNRSA
jgi:transcriptional regulator with XRE-family HTH domain